MICRHTHVVPGEPNVFSWPTRCSQTYHNRSLQNSVAVMGDLSYLKGGQNTLAGSHTLLKMTHLSLHSISSQTLREASSEWNTFCWCSCCYASLEINCIQVFLQSYCIIACKCICHVAPLQVHSASLSSNDNGLQMHLSTCSISAC